jgi:hypothetical protein
MPKTCPDFLNKMFRELTYGEAVIGKNGNLIMTRSEDGRYATVRHFGTLTLWLDFWKEGAEKVIFHYGQSPTDARYINAVFNFFNLHNFSAHYGKTNGWSVYYHGEEPKPTELPYHSKGSFESEVKIAEVRK